MDSETWMNANKAIELGFADDILEDTKKGADIPAYAFSGKAAEVSLMNKLHTRMETDKKPAAPAIPDGPAGTPIASLEKRLNLLKP